MMPTAQNPEPDDSFIAASEVRGSSVAVVGGETVGVSPKVLASVLAYVVAWVLTHYGVSISDEVEQLIAVVAGAVAGAVAPPGKVQERQP